MVVHGNISEKVTMGGKSTSNDNDYYYYSRGVGKVVNQPYVDCFPFICLALAVNIALLVVILGGDCLSQILAKKRCICRNWWGQCLWTLDWISDGHME